MNAHIQQPNTKNIKALLPEGVVSMFKNWGVVIAISLAAGAAQAEDTLSSITYEAKPGGAVDVILNLETGATEATVFATSDPPRIAVDLPSTASKVQEKTLDVSVGATKSIATVEAGGRTRVVIDLFRAAPYKSRRQGKSVVIEVANGFSEVIDSRAPVDPAKQVLGESSELTAVDFRRGKAGEGRLILNFTTENATANLRETGGRLSLDLANVTVPDRFARKLDVNDFATPVEAIEVTRRANGASLVFIINGEYEKLAYQAGTEYVVEISRKAEKEEERRPNDPPVYVGNRVTFNFQDIPVRSVLQLVADVSELNIVVADSVQGNVTLRLINVPWDQALDIILQAKGLDKRRNGQVIWVAPTEEIAEREQALEDARIAMEDRQELMVDYIPISYGKAEDMAKLLTTEQLENTGGGQGQSGGGGSQQGVLSSRGTVAFDSRTNTLIVTDIPDRITKVRELVAILDRAVRQVLIESRIVIAEEGFRKQIGARFGLSGAGEDSDGNLITIGGSLGATDQMIGVGLANRLAGNSSGLPVGIGDATGAGVASPLAGNRLNFNLPVVDPGAGSFATSILGADYILDLELSALESEDRGELLSSPKVITADQQEAVIKQGQEVGYVTLQAGGGAGVPTATVQFKEIVLELLVTPRITSDGRVFLTLKVKKDNLAGFIQTPGGQVPIIDKREVQTGALVDNGQTVVLGGIYEFERNNTLSKVPILGDIPAVGGLFRNRDNRSSKVELLIFVTPKILSDVKP